MTFAIEFFARRISQGLAIVLLVAFAIFTLLRVVPGDPIRIILGPMTPANVLEETAKQLGLRDPIAVQFARFLGEVATGDLGHSFIRGVQGGSSSASQDSANSTETSRAPVAQLMASALPYSLQLAALGIFFALLLALPLGLAAGLHAGRWPDRLGLYLSSLCVSLPNIWVGVVLIYLLSAKGGLLPAIGYQGFDYTIIPAMVLAIELAPAMMRSVSISIASNLGEPYFDAGLVRGLCYRTMVSRHVLRNAAIPLLNLFGAQMIGMLLGGLFVVEYIFSYPGIGLLTINAVFQRDFPIIQAVAIGASGCLVSVNMLVDYIATRLDRRLQF